MGEGAGLGVLCREVSDRSRRELRAHSLPHSWYEVDLKSGSLGHCTSSVRLPPAGLDGQVQREHQVREVEERLVSQGGGQEYLNTTFPFLLCLYKLVRPGAFGLDDHGAGFQDPD